MDRVPTPQETEKKVLLLSRRRCCICFGLNRDTELKQGQIAHLDQDSSNSDLENLAFLCLFHHDQYDSKTSQSKGLRLAEVLHFRKELYDAVALLVHAPVKIGSLELEGSGIFGRYLRDGSGDWASAELQVTAAEEGRVKVRGLSMYGISREFGPNFGQLDFEVPLRNGKVIFDEPDGQLQYRIVLTFERGLAFAAEQLVRGYFGMNANFAGVYRKVEGPHKPIILLHEPIEGA
jgi:hypothetical protein